ncbi:hypothetical protein LCGC14_2921920, partial [marine sediment metagenome]
LVVMEVVPVDVILNENFIRSLEKEDRMFMHTAVSPFGGSWV